MSRRVYIAAPLEHREDARKLAGGLSAAGFVVSSTWHCGPAVDRAAEGALPEWRIARELAANEHEIAHSDAVIVLYASSGRETLVELGLALAARLPIIVYDVVRLASYRRPGVEWIDGMAAGADMGQTIDALGA